MLDYVTLGTLSNVPSAVKSRVRRSPTVARKEILDAAERAFASGGTEAVRVQTVARDVGITDAAVHYHFGSREGLLEALLRRAGRRLKDELKVAVAKWDADRLDVRELVRLLDETYDVRGYARLSMWLIVSGFKSRGAGLFEELASVVHRARVERARRDGETPPPLRDTLFTVELLSLVMWAEALSGEAWRRSVGLRPDRATRTEFVDWFSELVAGHIVVGETPRKRGVTGTRKRRR